MTETATGSRLDGRRVALCGRLASMTHWEAADLIEAYGGHFERSVTHRTLLLVVGQDQLPIERDGRLPAALDKARRRQAAGWPLEVVTEEEFLSRLGLDDHRSDIRRRYTIGQLTRILGVRRDCLRRWVRDGLIQPVEVVHRLCYFDFAQVASAKLLSDLTRGGIDSATLKESLGELREWMPELSEPLAQLSLLERSGRLLVRLPDGSLAETGGQLHLEFAADSATDDDLAPLAIRAAPNGAAGPRSRPSPRTLEEAMTHALELEAAGRWEEAAEAYRNLLLSFGPHAEACFNLGNVLYAARRPQQALERFHQAVEIDPEYAEAWNNLGNVLAELGQPDKAARALRRALDLDPNYPDAHFNLAEVLIQLDQAAGACGHFERYLSLDPRSIWADHARRRLAEWRGPSPSSG